MRTYKPRVKVCFVVYDFSYFECKNKSYFILYLWTIKSATRYNSANEFESKARNSFNIDYRFEFSDA